MSAGGECQAHGDETHDPDDGHVDAADGLLAQVFAPEVAHEVVGNGGAACE